MSLLAFPELKPLASRVICTDRLGCRAPALPRRMRGGERLQLVIQLGGLRETEACDASLTEEAALDVSRKGLRRAGRG